MQHPGFARAGTSPALLGWPPSLALSVKAFIKTGLVTLHPGGSAETFWPFLEFPELGAGCEKSWMKRSFPFCSSAGPAGVGHSLGVSKNSEVVGRWSLLVDCCLSVQTIRGISDSMGFPVISLLASPNETYFPLPLALKGIFFISI